MNRCNDVSARSASLVQHEKLGDSGEDFALLRFDPRARISGLIDAAAQRGAPLKLIEVDAQSLYAHNLVLLRPDRHVAWRGDEEPADPVALIELVRGAGTAAARNAA